MFLMGLSSLTLKRSKHMADYIVSTLTHSCLDTPDGPKNSQIVS